MFDQLDLSMNNSKFTEPTPSATPELMEAYFTETEGFSANAKVLE